MVARGDEPVPSTTVAATPSTTTSDATDTSTVDPDEPVSSDDPTTSTTSTTSTSAAPPGAAGPCASADSVEGLAVEVCLVGVATAETDTVIRVRASDDDAQVRNDCGSPYVVWGDGGDTAVCEIGCVPSAAPAGPSSIETTYDHRYAERGTYDVVVTVESNCGEPPGARSSVTLEIQVV